MEEFKVIEGFDRYSVSSYGRVINNRTGRELSARKSTNGYLRVNLRKGDIPYEKPYTVSVHSLVGKAFLPKEDGKDYINHKDLDKTNNHVGNLEWCTPKENSVHAYKNKSDYQKKCIENLKISHEKSKKEILVWKNGDFMGVFKGKRAISDKFGVDVKTVYNGLKGMKNRQGYVFRYRKGGGLMPQKNSFPLSQKYIDFCNTFKDVDADFLEGT